MKPNNQPAFPVIHPAGLSHQGMTLRDYFAAQAMQGLIQASGHKGDVEYDVEAVVESAFTMADAMLAAREQ